VESEAGRGGRATNFVSVSSKYWEQCCISSTFSYPIDRALEMAECSIWELLCQKALHAALSSGLGNNYTRSMPIYGRMYDIRIGRSTKSGIVCGDLTRHPWLLGKIVYKSIIIFL